MENCKCYDSYFENMNDFFKDIPQTWYIILKNKNVKPHTQFIIIHEILDFVHGVSIIQTTSFYDLMHKFSYLERMFKRHTRYLVEDLGKDMINSIIDWYEHKIMYLRMQIRCGPQHTGHLTIKTPPTHLKIETPS